MCMNCESRAEARTATKPIPSDPLTVEVALNDALGALEEAIAQDLPADAPTPRLDKAVMNLMEAMGIPPEAIVLAKKAKHAADHIKSLEKTIQTLAAGGDYQRADQIVDALLEALHTAGEKTAAILETTGFTTALEIHESKTTRRGDNMDEPYDAPDHPLNRSV